MAPEQPADPITGFVGFTRALRAAGVRTRRAQDFIEAISRLDAGSRDDVYWAGRATLCDEPDDIPTYDRVFRSWFVAELVDGGRGSPTTEVRASAEAFGEDENDSGSSDAQEDAVAATASPVEQLRHRDVAELSAAERRRVNAMLARLDARGPQRRSRRRYPARRGDIDIARTVRDQLRRGGEPGPLRRRSRRSRPRRVVVLIDVSGSMQPYADSLLRLAHRMVGAAPRTTEVFTLGTRLTRVTPALRQADPEEALASVGSLVPDWSGGTRLGEVLQAFVDRWGQRGVARGAVVVIASDGWERGGATLLGEQVGRLRLLAHAIVWANPHRGKPGYVPVQGGIKAAMPFLDGLVAGHSLAAFAELMEVVRDA
ncbi:vWA domain-containing protein [Janibacter alittae]|uniref:VWA domain-containing protein n=1 Tax=Janibacter alittae TaxID=3115209 RepID=A0ABZ2MGD6_9MICO